MKLTDLTLKECRDGLRAGNFSASELTEAVIEKIEKEDNYNSFVLKTFERARMEAAKSDKRIKKGEVRSLEGVIIGVKDLYCTKDVETTACSNILKGFIPKYESCVTERLFSEGVNMAGKLNMDEMAMGATNLTSCYGGTVNPHDKTRMTGGSSGGSAAAVASGLVPAALASETGDSIRVPAALTGVVGFKPSYGRVSRFGMIGYSSSLDQAGMITKNVEDAAILLKFMAGHDKRDTTTSLRIVPDYEKLLNSNVKGLKIGIIKEYKDIKLHPEIEKGISNAISALEKAGAVVSEVSIPHAKYAGDAYVVLANAEASSNLSRYDGVRFGIRSKNQNNLDDMYANTRSEGFGWQIKRRLVIGSYILSAGQYEKYFLQAQRVRRLIYNEFCEAFKNVDIILSSVTADIAPKLSDAKDNTEAFKSFANKSDMLTLPMSMAGLPCVSVPIGKIDGLPFSLQLAGKRFDEMGVLNSAFAVEKLKEVE